MRKHLLFRIPLLSCLALSFLTSGFTFVEAVAAAASVPASQQEVLLPRPKGVEGTIVVPNHFLRRWDPVTIFFETPRGPAGGGPEDSPERLVRMTPEHPGAFTWLDASTLQFKPVEPWPSMARFRWQVDGKTFTVVTLASPPTATKPADKALMAGPVSEVALTFSEPLDPAALKEMVTIEIRQLPGIDASRSRWLRSNDFEIKSIEREYRNRPAQYVLLLKKPIPLGTRAIVKMRLSLDDSFEDAFSAFSFSTAQPFRVTSIGGRRNRFPITPEGSKYTREQAINCGSGSNRAVIVEFTNPPRSLGPVEARNLVRFTPSVEKLNFSLRGQVLEVTGDFKFDTLYQVRLAPAPIWDQNNRALEIENPSEAFLYFPKLPDYVRMKSGHGIIERFGPQMIPVEGRGEERVDLRIHKIPALDLSFWPFPDEQVSSDESLRPPGPGEEEVSIEQSAGSVSYSHISDFIRQLGTPLVSELVPLPLSRDGGGGSFGLDLEPFLSRASGKGAPGTYLVGIRDISQATTRSWARIQVTDLSLSTVEEPQAVHFLVTSLSTASPVAGATIRLEALANNQGESSWVIVGEGVTGSDGSFHWAAPGPDKRPNTWRVIHRIAVSKDQDVLVLDPFKAPDRYSDNHWDAWNETWMQWSVEHMEWRAPRPQKLAHIFTERPVYRPEEPVYIKGYVRQHHEGRLSIPTFNSSLLVTGPGNQEWKYPLQLSATGSFYHEFLEEDLPTGDYRVYIDDPENYTRLGGTPFRKESYRIPRFEVQLHSPEWAPLDQEFKISLTAEYYAGGRAGGLPVQWRVTQFPLTWTPKKLEGFLYSSDGRYTNVEPFPPAPRLDKEDATDVNGSASILLNPAIEPTSHPRVYAVEATVAGADGQTVTAVQRIEALPPFVLGIKSPRYLPNASQIEPEFVVVDPKGTFVGGKEVKVKLLRREWHSHLNPSDFTDGIARYITDVVDVEVRETTVQSSSAGPSKLTLPIDQAGVYIIELESHDALDRAQVVRIDLYAGGEEPVSWAKPSTKTFVVSPDAEIYDPGMTASLVLQSPFQNARALAIVEAPDRNHYSWVEVKGGAAVFEVPIEGHFTPRLPVHFVLMRGRLEGTGPIDRNGTDLGKPATLASTVWLRVNPVANRLKLELIHPKTARPGQTIDVTIKLTDPDGNPLSGEVTLWLVDQAVLSLGKEQRLDPVPDFLRAAETQIVLRDTRNLAFGQIPFAPNPGGGVAAEGAPGGGVGGLFDRVTVRRDFKPVPYYNPAISVGPDGSATVQIQLSDDLTNFAVRAKAVSGPQRFGYAWSQLAVRLPVIVQPALPRFVRPGDTFAATAISRVVQGEGGAGRSEIEAEGLEIEGEPSRTFSWNGDQPERVEYPVKVETPGYTDEGTLQRDSVKIRVAVERSSDQAADAFDVSLPIRSDRDPVVTKRVVEVSLDQPLQIPGISTAVRPGTMRRSILVSDQPGLIQLSGGLSFFLDYPYGCTEQQLSKARAFLALSKFREMLHQKEFDRTSKKAVEDVMLWLPSTIDPQGLAAYWPGSRGYVTLTAWVVQFMVEAREAGFTVDNTLLNRLTASLERALRSDYGGFIQGEDRLERAWALAALAQAGKFNRAYGAEMARSAQFLNAEGAAQVLLAFARANEESAATEKLTADLWGDLEFSLFQGREMFTGLQDPSDRANGLVLPSETRAVAEITRALSQHDSANPRLQLLVDGLVNLGKGDGWGTTNANASALLALSEILSDRFEAAGPVDLAITIEGQTRSAAIGPQSPVVYAESLSTQPAEVRVVQNRIGKPLLARLETRYLPAETGSSIAPEAQGFVVTRQALKVIGEDQPPERLALGNGGAELTFKVGQVIEDHVQIVNPSDRNYVAITVPLAAGMEGLNPRLATAPPEAQPSGELTMEPSYVGFMDDYVAFYYDALPSGTYDFYFRTRATIPGSFIQPAAKVEMMYDSTTRANSAGARVVIQREEGQN